MKKDTFKITRMDCNAEEQLVRMKLEPYSEVKKLEFDLPKRMLIVFHTGETATMEQQIAQLNLNSTLVTSENTDDEINEADNVSDRRLLWVVLAINAGFFVIEVVAGFVSNSMGLVADSLDMLADAIVYGMSLMVIGSTMVKKKRIAKLSGYFQLSLAVLGLVEVVRRFAGENDAPEYLTMVFVALFALVGNAVSLYLLQKKKSSEAHMEASYIFTSNDVIANMGVIIAGVTVYFTQSVYPDLVIGSLVFLLVARGAFRILKLAK